MRIEQDSRTGSRIRSRRLHLGIKQAVLARQAEISASYLNLIEHNRRRIGGGLLNRLAQALDVAPDALTKGAEAALIAQLQHAASRADQARPEAERVDDFTGRFPGWAGLVAEQSARIARLEDGLARLSDRMTHDPHLAASLHDLLSTITSIRSTASILAGSSDITPEWRARFDRNIHEDSRRLSEASQSLVSYLDTAGSAQDDPALSPADEVSRLFDQHGFHVPELETGDTSAAMARLGAGLSEQAREVLEHRLTRMAEDARALPLPQVQPVLARAGLDPPALGAALNASPATLLRRLAHLPADLMPGPLGLVICDAAGAIIHRREMPDFSLPRYDAACARWPLFEALSRPGVPLTQPLTGAGREGGMLQSYSVAEPVRPVGFDGPAQLEAVMLIHPHPQHEAGGARSVGPTCRICPAEGCAQRRVPSLVAGGSIGF